MTEISDSILKAIAKKGIEDRIEGFSVDESDISDIEWGQRYGGKATVKVEYNEVKYDLVLLFMGRKGSTGQIPKGSKIATPAPIYHPKLSLEWACSVATVKDEDNVDYTYSHVTHVIVSNSITEPHFEGKGLYGPEATVYRQVETEEILIENPKHAEGRSFKIGDPHLLNNTSDGINIVLINSVEKGKALRPIDVHYVEQTGGFKKYAMLA